MTYARLQPLLEFWKVLLASLTFLSGLPLCIFSLEALPVGLAQLGRLQFNLTRLSALQRILIDRVPWRDRGGS